MHRKGQNTRISAYQVYLIGTVNTIQSIQCSKKHKHRLPNGTQTKSAKTHHLVDFTKTEQKLKNKRQKKKSLT